MITLDQIKVFSKKYRINQTVIYREYLQLLWLSHFYKQKQSSEIYFKGGTAIHLIYNAPRFSEDLDFTSEVPQQDLDNLVNNTLKEVKRNIEIEIKERKVLAGKTYLLTALPSILPFKTFVKLDFSFREKVIKPAKSTIETDYPILFTSYIHHLSKEEIFAEKVRAILSRKKGRDIYDLWYLLTIGTEPNTPLIKEKLAYYNLKFGKNVINDLYKKISDFGSENFAKDLAPFVSEAERARLPELYEVIKDYLKRKFSII
ncbi:MAG: hypothetical protein ACD_57C00387G0005 [uncultured bacterium]|nr:MAG: hypothetical protein ACD_57C00387G0005 [uncultured bacterium]